jgi:DNA-binding winged helix-turn-helix (wHTH) protein
MYDRSQESAENVRPRIDVARRARRAIGNGRCFPRGANTSPIVGPRDEIERESIDDISGSAVAAPALARFQTEPRVDARRDLPGSDTDRAFFGTRSNPTVPAPGEIAFGPFRLLPAQFLLLEGDSPVRIGSRALGILIVLLERPSALVSKQELMDRVWPNIFVETANLTVHISALRRTLRDGRDGNRFIINVPGRGYSFVASVETARPACDGSPCSR